MERRYMIAVATLASAMGAVSTASAATVSYYLNQSGNATAGALSVDGVNYAIVTISDDFANNEIDFSVELLPNVIAQFNPSSNNAGIKSFGFNANPNFTAFSGTSAASNGFLNLLAGSGYNWTVPSSKSMDGFGTFEAKLDNTGSARVSNLSFSLDTSVARWLGYTALNFYELSTGSAPQGYNPFAVAVTGISTAGAQGGNPFFGGGAPVPLPAAAWLLVSGLGMLGFVRRKDRAAG